MVPFTANESPPHTQTGQRWMPRTEISRFRTNINLPLIVPSVCKTDNYLLNVFAVLDVRLSYLGLGTLVDDGLE
jgi:hypothetical protein